MTTPRNHREWIEATKAALNAMLWESVIHDHYPPGGPFSDRQREALRNLGNSLSYELATTFIGLAARDWPTYAAFVNAANGADAREAAAQKHLGVAHLAEAVLGAGNWRPNLPRLKEGAERGQS